MQNTTVDSVEIRPYIGTRSIGGKLCLINQKLREVWICGGISPRIWERLTKGMTVGQITSEFSAKYKVAPEKISDDIGRFLEQLWQRQIIDLPGRESVSDDERAAMVREEAHNKSGILYEEALKAEVLFRVWLDLLIPCNLRCRHCYLDFSEKDIVPISQIFSYLDQLSDHGCPELVLTGGEIFLRKDLLDIIAYTESKGFLFDLYTNGNYINKEMADRLSKHRISTVQISVYGTSAPVHEAITRKAGTFDKSINAAKLLIERGIPVRLQCHIQHDNFEDAFRFPEFAASLGADYEFDTKLVPNRDGSADVFNYSVTVQQQAELYKAGLIKRSPTFICTAAASKARINAHGDIYPCELINTAVVGNLKKQTLAEIWASPSRTALRGHILGYKPKRCGGCNHVSDCEPCAAMRGYNQENHMDAPVSEACMMTTASLLAQGKDLAENSPFRILTDDGCVATILAQAKKQERESPFRILNNSGNGH